MSQAQAEQPCEHYGDICWIEFPATDMKRCQTFYSAVFGWEFAKAPGMPESSDEPGYVLFSKPGTKLAGGVVRVKEENIIRPKLNSDGCGETTNRITMRVEEVEAALKKIEAAGGTLICGKKEIPGDMGFYGAFRDTEGNVNGVWSKK